MGSRIRRRRQSDNINRPIHMSSNQSGVRSNAEPLARRRISLIRRFARAVVLLLATATAAVSQNPYAASTADDGIPDSYKTTPLEIHVPGKPTAILDLSKQCVKDQNGRFHCIQKNQKAIVVLVDWMADGSHSHRPQASTENGKPRPGGTSELVDYAPLSRIQRTFLDHGIILAIIFADQLFKNYRPIDEKKSLGLLNDKGEYIWKDFVDLRTARTGDFDRLFGHGFHYAAFIHTYAGQDSSGLSRTIPGDEFLISLGNASKKTGTADQQAGTFMHELGHNLGLRHGGADNTHYKPNYLSVMNYMFQMSGIGADSTFGLYSYSDVELGAIREDSLDPDAPLAPGVGIYSSAYACFDSPAPSCNRTSPQQPAHFDIVGSIAIPPIAWACKPPMRGRWDVNGDGCYDQLNGYNDWGHLKFKGSAEPVDPNAAAGAPPLPMQELPATWRSITPSIPPESVKTVQGPDGVVSVTWSPITSQEVVGYQIWRKSPWGESLLRQSRDRSLRDDTAKPGVTYSYLVVPIFYGSRERLQDLLDKVPDAIVADADSLLSRARKVLPDLSEPILVRGFAAQSKSLTVK